MMSDSSLPIAGQDNFNLNSGPSQNPSPDSSLPIAGQDNFNINPNQSPPPSSASEPSFGQPDPNAGMTHSVSGTGNADPIDWGDVGKSALAQGTLGLTDIVGLPGFASQLYNKAIMTLGKYAIAKPAEWMGMLPKGATADGLMSDIQGLQNDYASPAEKKGLVSTTFGIPLTTGAGVQALTQSVLPFTNYQSTTNPGKYAGAAARFGTGMAETGGLGEAAAANSTLGSVGSAIAKNLGAGAAAGIGSEAGNELGSSVPGISPYTSFAGAALSSLATHKIGNAVKYLGLPTASAEGALTDALQSDRANRTATMTPDQINSAVASGASPTVYDMGGPKTRALINHYGFMTPQAQSNAAALTDFMDERSANASAAVADHIDNLFGGNLNAGALEAYTENAAKATNNNLYSIARSDPAAASIWSPDLEQLSKNPTFKEAMKRANRDADVPNFDFGADPNNQMIKYSPGTPDVTTPSSIQGPNGEPILQTTLGTPPTYPNLAYWDRVKQHLGDMSNSEFQSGNKANAANITQTLKAPLVSALDAAVPAYKTARNAAAEGFGATDSVGAGYNFMKGMNSLKAQPAIDAFNSMSPDQQQLFSQGAASWAKDTAGKNLGSFVKQINDPAIQARMRMALGDDNFNSIYGRANAENVLSKVKPPSPPTQTQSPWVSMAHAAGFPAAGALILPEVASKIMHGEIPFSAGAVAGSAAAAVGGLGVRSVMNAAERRIAPQIINMASSQDPETIKQLGAVLSSTPVAASTMQKLTENATRAGITAFRANQATGQNNQRPGHKFGGSVEVNYSKMADDLINKAEKTREGISKTTEPLLNSPDSSIVKALAIANQGI